MEANDIATSGNGNRRLQFGHDGDVVETVNNGQGADAILGLQFGHDGDVVETNVWAALRPLL